MSVPHWAWESARRFRASLGALPLFPFDLRAALVWAPQLRITEKQGLTVSHAVSRLKQAGCVAPREADRPLRACLVARRGAGWIFLESDAPPDEKRFSLAHEVAHFLRHHWQPRQKAAALGREAVAAFDGDRDPTDAERLGAVLLGASLRVYSHLMRREPEFVPLDVQEAEDEADVLACELLAPEDEVRSRMVGDESVLRDTFGLPAGAARNYAARLWPKVKEWDLLSILKNRAKVRRTS